jgi:hypothetical protein
MKYTHLPFSYINSVFRPRLYLLNEIKTCVYSTVLVSNEKNTKIDKNFYLDIFENSYPLKCRSCLNFVCNMDICMLN